MVIEDPEAYGEIVGSVFLFLSDEQESGQPFLRQDAGQRLVNYSFNLTTIDAQTGSNNYFDVYKIICDEFSGLHACKDKVMNPEDSWFMSDHYQRHYAENW